MSLRVSLCIDPPASLSMAIVYPQMACNAFWQLFILAVIKKIIFSRKIKQMCPFRLEKSVLSHIPTH